MEIFFINLNFKMSQTVFILDLYDKFSPDKVISTFKMNNRWWAIKEVSLKWGIPQLSSIEEDNPMLFQLYETKEEAEKYVRKIRKLNS